MGKLLKRDEGFTLIEIVLVLAIAGLIMVIVFIAVSGANKARRDTQRKSDAGRFLAAVESCASNSGGSYTTCASSGIPAAYITGKDPNGTAYSVVSAAPAAGQVLIQGSACPGSGHSNVTASVTVFQEQGGSFCVDNGS